MNQQLALLKKEGRLISDTENQFSVQGQKSRITPSYSQVKPYRRGQRGNIGGLMLILLTITLLVYPVSAFWGFEGSQNEDGANVAQDGQNGARFAQNDTMNSFDSSSAIDSNQKKISSMNALLPISSCDTCRKVKFELYATNGCYQWKNSHPQIISMTDMNGNSLDHGRPQNSNECVNRVFLEAKTLRETKSIILITARDINSGTTLKCNTKVGHVDRLDIFTRSKQFSVNSNQQLIVVGYDDEDNIFSSMDGFRFDWSITEGKDVVKKFSAPDTGSRNLHHTDFFFIRSTKPGLADVAVKLEEPGYESVLLVTKKLTVVDPFIIQPSEPVYILPTSEFQFSLVHLDMDSDSNDNRPITIPDPQYKWSTAQSEIGLMGDDGKFRSKINEGEAEILVKDQQMLNNTAEGSIHVVHPYRLEVTIRDVTEMDVLKRLHAGDNVEEMLAWSKGQDLFDMSGADSKETAEMSLADTHILIEEHYYQIKMYLYDKDGHLITLTDNLRFKTLGIDQSLAEVIKQNNIGSELVIKTKKIAEDKIKINSQHKLDEIIPAPQTGGQTFSNFANRLTQDKELIITKPVKIQHPTNLVLLPFLPAAQEAHGNGEIWNLSSRGGSGVYLWSIVDNSVASVQGSAQVRSIAVGKTSLICRDQKNLNNWDTIDVEVALLNQLAWIEEQVEIKAPTFASQAATNGSGLQVKAFGEVRVLSLFAMDSRGRKFTNCTAVRPSYEVKGDKIIAVTEGYDSQSADGKYRTIKDYIFDASNEELINIRQRFDEQELVTFTDQLQTLNTPTLTPILMRHNNFGVCAQQEVQGEGEGLARLRASYSVQEYANGPRRLVQSEFAEIAVFNELASVDPLYKPHMSDLYSVNYLGQEFQSFESFYQDWKLNLQFGSSLVWKVTGGSNFWPDQTSNYQTSWRSEPAGEKMFEIKERSVLTTESVFDLRCLTPKDQKVSQRARVTLQQASRSSRSLIRPVMHETQVEIHCEPPKSVKLLWAQQYSNPGTALSTTSELRPLVQLPRSRIVQNERRHFVLVNSRHSVRYLMLDSEHQVSFNSSSVLTTVYPSDKNMAEVSLLDQDEQVDQISKRTYNEDVLSGIYDKRTVQFKNLTGTVYINAESSHYLEDYTVVQKEKDSGFFSFGGNQAKSSASKIMTGVYKPSITGDAYQIPTEPVKNRMVVEVVRNVDVEPKFKSLYIGSHQQTYKLKILHGSGAFSVTVNNTDLVDFIQKDREIHLTPKELGGLKIMVEDLDLPQSEIATAELLISDIHKLTLWAPKTLIEEGTEMELLVSAYDSFMKEFDPDQYALMHFEIETETMGLRRTGGLQSLQIPDQIRKFNANGREPGIYQLTAFSLAFVNPNKLKSTQASTMQTIVSEMLRIEVFPLLEIYPSNLLITPNMRYTLQIVGGPQTAAKTQQIDGSHVEIKFDIENKDVATIDRFREVTGHQEGDAILTYEIIQLRTTQNNILPHMSVDSDGKGVVAPVTSQSRIVSQKKVKIRVRLVTDIEIPFTHQRQIFTGSLIKMMAILKYEDELFHHGIAPISYNWICTEGRVLELDLPTKQELAQVHGIASNLVMTSRYIRDNEKNRDKVEFFTSFNSSSIYADGQNEGETIVSVQLAIEYPEKYRRQQNWFKASVTVKVTDRLTINVPQYSAAAEKETHMYLVPPHTLTKIETNKQTRLKLGYSQQSVFDYSTQQYKYQEATSPIIELVNDEAIRTFDKYGKVTLLVEEGGAFSDQIVMLNVKIADAYTMATMRAYDALSLPLGSSLTLPIHLQDDHAHKFADKISGVSVGIYLSHPRVVQVSLDQYSESLTIQSMGSGDCNIFMFLVEHPHIFDVIRVRVSGVVQPLSPVYLHLGGEINFRVESTDSTQKQDSSSTSGTQGSQVIWSSGNPSVLQIEPESGKAAGKREGKADVLLSNHANAASIVHVSKVAYAQLDQKSQLIINADNTGSSYINSNPEYRVRIKLFLEKQPEEMMPTVQFDGITLIRQKIGIKCESDQTNYVMARGEVNDLEGFYCVMTYVQGADNKGMPRFVKIKATAYGEDQDGKTIYSELVSEFEMQLISDIMIETKFMKGIDLCQNKRTQSIRVFSSSDFKVSFNYGAPDEDGQLVIHSVAPVDENTNEYSLTLQVPAQVSHSFDASVILSHQFASKPRVFPLHFLAETDCGASTTLNNNVASSQVSYEGKEPANQGSSWWYSGEQAHDSDLQQQLLQTQQALETAQNSQGTSYLSYFIFIIALILVVIFVSTLFFDINLLDMYDSVTGRYGGRDGPRVGVGEYRQHRNNQKYAQYQTNLNLSNDGIRPSSAQRRQPLSRDQTFSSFGRDQSGMSGSAFRKPQQKGHQSGSFRQQNQQQQPNAMNLDEFSIRQGQRRSQMDSLQDSARYY